MPTLYHFLSSNVTIEFSVNMASIQQMLSSHQTSLQAKQHSKKSQSVTNYWYEEIMLREKVISQLRSTGAKH